MKSLPAQSFDFVYKRQSLIWYHLCQSKYRKKHKVTEWLQNIKMIYEKEENVKDYFSKDSKILWAQWSISAIRVKNSNIFEAFDKKQGISNSYGMY